MTYGVEGGRGAAMWAAVAGRMKDRCLASQLQPRDRPAFHLSASVSLPARKVNSTHSLYLMEWFWGSNELRNTNARPIFMNYIHFTSLFVSCPSADVQLLMWVVLHPCMGQGLMPRHGAAALYGTPSPGPGMAWHPCSLDSHSRASFHVSDELYEMVFVVLWGHANGSH